METLIVKNFGAVKDVTVELKNLTIFIGKTGTGKSTLAKLIAIFRQPQFYYKAKSFQSLLTEFKISDFLQKDTFISYESSIFSFSYTHNKEIEIALTTSFEGTINNFLREKNANYNIDEDLIEKTTKIFLNQAVPQNIYIPTERMLFSLFDEWKYEEKYKEILPFVLEEFGKYLNRATQKLSDYKVDMFGVSYQKVGTKNYVKLANEKMLKLSVAASGMQTVIPALLVMDYYSSDKDHKKSFVFEEPELNLFPTAQKALVEFMAEKVLNRGHQLVICTHSDHILYSILIECKKYDDSNGETGIFNQKTAIYYLRDEEDVPFVTEVKIEQGGKIRKFPDNFFDQHKKYIRELL